MTTYRPYRPGVDDAVLLRLRANVWGAQHPHTNPDFLRWLYVDCPGGRGGGILAMDGEAAVGFAGMMARKGRVNARAVRIAKCVDFMMHSDARGGATAFRIMSHWSQHARDHGFDFGLGYPNTHSHDLVTRGKLGWVDAIWPDHLIRPLSRAAAPQGMLPRVPLALVRGGTALLKMACVARSALSRTRRPAGRAVRIERFDERAEALWQAIAADDGYCGLVRDLAYLEWRYRQHPVYTYEAIGWEVDGRLVGCLFTSTRQLFGVASRLLVDLLIDPSASAGVTEALIDHLTGPETERHTPMLHALAVPRTSLREALAHTGFLAIPRRVNPKPFVMTAHELAGPIPFADDWRPWQFRWGDMDVV